MGKDLCYLNYLISENNFVLIRDIRDKDLNSGTFRAFFLVQKQIISHASRLKQTTSHVSRDPRASRRFLSSNIKRTIYTYLCE